MWIENFNPKTMLTVLLTLISFIAFILLLVSLFEPKAHDGEFIYFISNGDIQNGTILKKASTINGDEYFVKRSMESRSYYFNDKIARVYEVNILWNYEEED